MNLISDNKIMSRLTLDFLPLKPNVSKRSYEELNHQAEFALQRLSAVSKVASSSSWMVHNFVRSESIFSCGIAGKQIKLFDVLHAEAGFETEIEHPTKWAMDCIAAYYLCINNISGIHRMPLNMQLIRDAHQKLINSMPGAPLQGGMLRRSFIESYSWDQGLAPPSIDSLTGLLLDLDQFIQKKPDHLPPLIYIAIICAQIKLINPFESGNRRIGRLLIACLLKKWCIISEPILYLSNYLYTNKKEYDKLLRKIYTDNDWDSWVVFFIKGILFSAQDAERRIIQTNNLLEIDRHTIQQYPSATINAHHLFALLPTTPYFTIEMICQKLGISFPSANTAVATLESLGILKETTKKKRNRFFNYQSYIELLF